MFIYITILLVEKINKIKNVEIKNHVFLCFAELQKQLAHRYLTSTILRHDLVVSKDQESIDYLWSHAYLKSSQWHCS